MAKDWTGRGTSYSDSPNREAPNKHLKGSKKYKEMIAKDQKRLDQKNLPFQFIKPPKRSQPRRDVFAVCTECTHVLVVNKYTCGATCSKCKAYTRIEEGENRFEAEEELVAYLEKLETEK